ncbi:unnamed protein product [Closterium sp. NIES-54]
MTTLRVLLHVAAQRDYELHSLDFSTAFLQGSLHEEIWLRRPPGFTRSFPAGTQWSLRRPVYSLRQAPREWHDTLRTTLASLGFAPSTADPSLFLRTHATLLPFNVLVYVDDLVFATADTEALAHVKSELQKRHTCTDLGELTSYLGLRITRDRAQCTITLTQSHMVQQVLQRFGFTYSSPLSTPLPTGHSLPTLPYVPVQHTFSSPCTPSGVRDLCPAPREWHDTLRTTLASLGFAPSTADPSLFLRTHATLLPFNVLVYVDDLVFATADTEALAHVKSELQKRHTCTDLGELTSYLGLRITRDRAQRTITLTQSHMVQQVLQRFGFTYSSPHSTPLPTGHSLSAPPSDESVEPSGPYPELVGCVMYLMTCTQPDLTYPLSLLARYVAPGRHRKVHWDAAKRVLRYLCSTSGMGLVLGGRARVALTSHADASWELRWLTYLLTDLGEAPRSPPVLYVDNKAMLALCQEHRLEHRTKHISLRYFLARELQQRGQLRLAYVASQANTADVFTKALQPCDHQRFCTVLGLVCEPSPAPPPPSPTAAAAAEGGGCVGAEGVVQGGDRGSEARGAAGAPVAHETVAPVAREPVAPVAREPVAPVAQESVAPAAHLAAEPVTPVARVLVAPVASVPVAPVARVPVALVAPCASSFSCRPLPPLLS